MRRMDFDVLPGPSLPELARTALARAATATVSVASATGGPAPAGPVPVRSTRYGSPLLLPSAGSPLARRLAASPDPVRVSLPAEPPFSALRLTGTARPVTVHMGELVRCVRAHGMSRAEWVIPRGLDRYGLELLVLTADGIAAVRLSFPDGPVSSLDDVPVSLRTALTCRCQAGPDHGHQPSHGGCSET
jgi:hypothetical protein